MLFTSSFKLLGAAAFMLPALLVSASPRPLLSERAGSGVVRHVMFHECVAVTANNADCPETFQLTLHPREDETDIFDVEGGWKGQPAIAEATRFLKDARDWKRNDPDALAYGHDGGELRADIDMQLTYYVIFKNEEGGNDSDGSGGTERG